jgi:hypothetical protein
MLVVVYCVVISEKATVIPSEETNSEKCGNIWYSPYPNQSNRNACTQRIMQLEQSCCCDEWTWVC